MSQDFPLRLRLKVITSKKILVDTETEAVALPGLDGEVGILPGHRPLILGLGAGPLTYRQGDKTASLFIQGGYATISASDVLVFTEFPKDDRHRPAEKQG